jgi:hypothetical protein
MRHDTALKTAEKCSLLRVSSAFSAVFALSRTRLRLLNRLLARTIHELRQLDQDFFATITFVPAIRS